MIGIDDRKIFRTVALTVAISLTGCASIVSKSSWPVNIKTNPSGAKCVIAKESGIQVHTGETPMTVVLESGDGFFQKANYNITCEKPGYQTTVANTTASLNGWYLGNIVFGGLIGILIIDPATGAMYKLDETQVVTLYSDNAEGRYQNSENLNSQGLEYYKNEDYVAAIASFNKAIDITPNHAEAFSNKALCLSKQGEYDKAFENVNKAINIKPDSSNFYRCRGDIFVMQGKADKALEDYTKTITLNPSDKDALFSRAKILMEQKRPEQAKADIAQACKMGNQKACNFQF